MAKKVSVTKTTNPLHFEDLEPHRFEDLSRQLIYDYKDWQTIEGIGRTGSDEGFDVRARERVVVPELEEQNSEDQDPLEPMDGNLWMIQCKRESVLGPARIASVIEETVDRGELPYGYILIAPANFSKQSQDIFREELKKRGVMEFYLWGKAELEDKLYLPKNDRILFTFFGISFLTQRRSRITEQRRIVTIKNKLIRLFGENASGEYFRNILIRDISNPDDYIECVAFRNDPRGILVYAHKRFCYVDAKKKVWDADTSVELLPLERQKGQEASRKIFEQRRLVEDYWTFFPIANKAQCEVFTLIPYESILLIDEKGDREYDFPHLYLDSKLSKDFRRKLEPIILADNDKFIYPEREGFKKVSLFPKFFPGVKQGKVYRDIIISNVESIHRPYGSTRIDKLGYFADKDGSLKKLKQGDIVQKESRDTENPDFLRITKVDEVLLKDLRKVDERFKTNSYIARLIGKDKFKMTEKVTIFEYEEISRYSLDGFDKDKKEVV